MPPAKIITRAWFDVWMPKNWSPGWLLWPSSSVEISNAFAVKALLMAMSMLPSHAPSMRANAVRLAAVIDDRNIHRLADLLRLHDPRFNDFLRLCHRHHDSNLLAGIARQLN